MQRISSVRDRSRTHCRGVSTPRSCVKIFPGVAGYDVVLSDLTGNMDQLRDRQCQPFRSACASADLCYDLFVFSGRR